MNTPFSFAVRNPVRLEPIETDLLSDDVAIVATDVDGNKLMIVASRARWQEALMPRFGVKPSQSEIARDMYVRGELEVDDFERVLDRELQK